MSELDDVQTTVGAIDGLRARIAELEAENERLKFQSYNELRHRAEIAEVGWESERTAYAELSTLYEHTRGQSEQAEAKLAEVTEDRNGFREAFNKCIERAEDAEDEVEKWKWLATHRFVCPLGEMNPGEPGSYIVEDPVNQALLDRWAERGGGK